MAQIVNAGYIPADNSGPSGLMQAFGQVSQAAQYLQGKKATEAANKFGAINNIIAKTFPDELGGFTAAYRSGNPQQAAAADQALGLYLNSVEGISGKRLRPEEREAIKSAFVNGQLTTKQLLASAQAIELGRIGEGQPQGGQPAQQVAPPGGNAVNVAAPQGPAGAGAQTTPVGQPPQGGVMAPIQGVELGPIQGSSSGYRNMEAMTPTQGGPTNNIPGRLGAGPLGEQTPPPGVAPQDRANATAKFATARAAGTTPEGLDRGVKTLQASAAQSKLAQDIVAKVGERAAEAQYQTAKARIGAKQATKVEQDFVTGYEALKGQKAQQPQVPAPKASPEEQRRSLVTQLRSTPPADRKAAMAETFKVRAQEVADEVSYATPNGRAIEVGPNVAIEFSQKELKTAEKSVAGANKILEDALTAEGPGAGTKLATAEKALLTTASMMPGVKEFSREWSKNIVDHIRRADPQELAALGLTEEAKIILDDDRNRILAEQNANELFRTISTAATTLTQLKWEYNIAQIDFAGKVAAASGTAAGAQFEALSKTFGDLSTMAKESFGGKPYTGAQWNAAITDAGFKGVLDYLNGMFGGQGPVPYEAPVEAQLFSPSSWIGLKKETRLRPPIEGEKGKTGRTVAAQAGYEAGIGAKDQPNNAVAFERFMARFASDADLQADYQQAMRQIFANYKGMMSQ